MLEAFVKRFPQPLNPAMEARDKLEQMAVKSGDTQARDHWLAEIIAADRTAGASRTDRSRLLAARATLTLAAPVRDEFLRIKLVAPLKKSLAAKRKAMEAALNAFSQAADYQVAEVTTAATFQSAELYRQLGKDVMSSERPKNLSKDELEQYDVLLEEQAFPFEEKAIQLYQVDTARAKQGVYDEWVRQSFAALAQLSPGRYAKAEVGGPQVDDARLADVEANFRQAAAAVPANPVAENELGIVERRLGKFSDAEAAYRMALEAQPDFAPAHLNLGVLYDLYLDQPQQALEQYERYMAIAGDDKQVAGWVAELRKRVTPAAPAAKKEPA
jgi:tetratricopeptide (TPR) repeat protein